jgi:hypothetical protein
MIYTHGMNHGGRGVRSPAILTVWIPNNVRTLCGMFPIKH